MNISIEKYDIIKGTILECLEKNELIFTELAKCVGKKLKNFEWSVPWYVEVVKLDLEARKIIERALVSKKQVYRLK